MEYLFESSAYTVTNTTISPFLSFASDLTRYTSKFHEKCAVLKPIIGSEMNARRHDNGDVIILETLVAACLSEKL